MTTRSKAPEAARAEADAAFAVEVEKQKRWEEFSLHWRANYSHLIPASAEIQAEVKRKAQADLAAEREKKISADLDTMLAEYTIYREKHKTDPTTPIPASFLRFQQRSVGY
jgi:hypothetical protein